MSACFCVSQLLAKDMEVREAARSCDERIRAADRRMLRLEQAVRSAREENKVRPLQPTHRTQWAFDLVSSGIDGL